MTTKNRICHTKHRPLRSGRKPRPEVPHWCRTGGGLSAPLPTLGWRAGGGS